MTSPVRTFTAVIVGGALLSLNSTAGAQQSAQLAPQQVPTSGTETVRPLTPDEIAGIRTIDAITSRSIEGLTFEHRSDGTIGLDLQGRFQNILRATTGPDGRVELVCTVEGHDHAAASIPAWTPNRTNRDRLPNVKTHLAAPIVVPVKKAPALEVK